MQNINKEAEKKKKQLKEDENKNKIKLKILEKRSSALLLHSLKKTGDI